MANDTAHDLAEELLNEAVVALVCSAITPPGLQYVGHGIIPWDCPLIAVNIDPAIFAPIDPRSQGCQIAPRITLNLTVLDCYPTQDEQGNNPTAAEMTAASLHLNSILWVLMRTIARGATDGTLFDQVDCHSIKLGQVTTLSPSGGLGGWQFPVLVQPHDTDPLCGS